MGARKQVPLQILAAFHTAQTYIEPNHWLAADGHDVNARGQYGETALHWAAMLGDTEAASNILECRNVDTGVRDCAGHTALELAKAYGSHAVATLIEKHVEKGNSPRVR